MKKHLDELLKKLPPHGGDILSAAKTYGIAPENWLDLSTGMNPNPYPVGNIPETAFHYLPYIQPAFIDSVHHYYGQTNFLAVSGTQSAIQEFPDILNSRLNYPVLVPEIGYREHAENWQRQGFTVVTYPSFSRESLVQNINNQLLLNPKQHVVVINPNNPTGVQIPKQQLLQWSRQLDSSAYLIIDEAFIDFTPKESLLTVQCLPGNVVVLRSFGKFFGLAGIRVGFVFSQANIIEALQRKLGIWQINGPAQWLTSQALKDDAWQQNARLELAKDSAFSAETFASLLGCFDKPSQQETPFFKTYKMSLTEAVTLNHALAEQGILTRVVIIDDKNALLRVGTFSRKDEVAIKKIRVALSQIK